MLTVTVYGQQIWNEDTEEFSYTEDVVVDLEHSLASLSKWESIWEKPFLGDEKKSTEEINSYLKCMVLTPNLPEEVFDRMVSYNMEEINNYIGKNMTATWFNDSSKSGGRSKEIITAEIIYYWMFAQNIPIECENWHLQRLFTLIKVISEKNAPKKKMGRREAMSQHKALNEARRAKFGAV